jgi:transcriptional regulator with XRE-family HTH domain
MDIDREIATQLKSLRAARGWTLAQAAQASGVSRAMISKIERSEASATAALLSRLATALDVPLSKLVAPPGLAATVARKSERPRWRDPATGFVRERVTPAMTASRVEIVEVELPPKAQVTYRQPQDPGYSQHVVALTDGLRVRQDEPVELSAGDALHMVPRGDFVFENTASAPCRYLVVMERDRSSA